MKPVENMTESERQDCLDKMRIFIESAVEGEQDEPRPFQLETEHRVEFVMLNIKEMLGLI